MTRQEAAIAWGEGPRSNDHRGKLVAFVIHLNHVAQICKPEM